MHSRYYTEGSVGLGYYVKYIAL